MWNQSRIDNKGRQPTCICWQIHELNRVNKRLSLHEQEKSKFKFNKLKVSTFAPVHFGKKDRIGCGINCSNSSFFFTKNS